MRSFYRTVTLRVILHTLGAKTGNLHLVPLVLTINDSGMLLFASFAGAKKNPSWVANLRAHPEITVELGTEEIRASIVEFSDDEAAEKVRIQAGVSEQFAEYKDKKNNRYVG